MNAERGGAVRDLGAPPTIDALVASFPTTVYGLVDQPRIEAFAANPVAVRGRTTQLGLSYSVFRHPLNRADPSNFVDLTPAQAAAIARAEESDLPPWMVDQIVRMRYPVLWDAVRTSLPIPAERADPVPPRLRAHVRDVLQRMPATPRETPGSRIRDPAAEEFVRGESVDVDGEPQRVVRWTGDPALIAFGFRASGGVVTAILERRLTKGLRVALESLAPSS